MENKGQSSITFCICQCSIGFPLLYIVSKILFLLKENKNKNKTIC